MAYHVDNDMFIFGMGSEIDFTLGINFDYDRQAGSLKMDQEKYIKSTTNKFGLHRNRDVYNPMRSGQKTAIRTAVTDEEWNEVKDEPFSNILQSINFVTHTRRDILYPYNFFSRRQKRYTKDDMDGLKHLQYYLDTTCKEKMVVRQDKNLKPENVLRVYADASWGDDTTRRSTGGMIVVLLNLVVYGGSKRLPSMSNSTGQAELQIGSLAGKEIVHYRRLTEALGWKVNDRSTVLYCDASSAIRMAYKMPGTSKLTRHIEICWFYIRELVMSDIVDVHFCPTLMQLADGVTKIQSTHNQELFREAYLDYMGSKLRKLHYDFMAKYGAIYFGDSA